VSAGVTVAAPPDPPELGSLCVCPRQAAILRRWTSS
jgi:hypothetical protein